MAFGDHPLLQSRVLHRILAHVEECRLDALLLENVENRSGVLSARSVIESQRDDLMALRSRRYADNLGINRLSNNPLRDAFLGDIADPNLALTVFAARFHHLNDAALDINRYSIGNRRIVDRVPLDHISSRLHGNISVAGKPGIAPIRRVNHAAVNPQFRRMSAILLDDATVHRQQPTGMGAEIVMVFQQLFRRGPHGNLRLPPVDEYADMTQSGLPSPRTRAHHNQRHDNQHGNQLADPQVAFAFARAGGTVVEREFFYFLHGPSILTILIRYCHTHPPLCVAPHAKTTHRVRNANPAPPER